MLMIICSCLLKGMSLLIILLNASVKSTFQFKLACGESLAKFTKICIIKCNAKSQFLIILIPLLLSISYYVLTWRTWSSSCSKSRLSWSTKSPFLEDLYSITLVVLTFVNQNIMVELAEMILPLFHHKVNSCSTYKVRFPISYYLLDLLTPPRSCKKS